MILSMNLDFEWDGTPESRTRDTDTGEQETAAKGPNRDDRNLGSSKSETENSEQSSLAAAGIINIKPMTFI